MKNLPLIKFLAICICLISKANISYANDTCYVVENEFGWRYEVRGFSPYGSSMFDNEPLTKQYFQMYAGEKEPPYIQIREKKRRAFILKILFWTFIVIAVILVIIYYIKKIHPKLVSQSKTSFASKSGQKITIDAESISKNEVKSISDEIEKLNQLRLNKIITEEEFIKLKNKLLS